VFKKRISDMPLVTNVLAAILFLTQPGIWSTTALHNIGGILMGNSAKRQIFLHQYFHFNYYGNSETKFVGEMRIIASLLAIIVIYCLYTFSLSK
jgi:hypothetical protein